MRSASLLAALLLLSSSGAAQAGAGIAGKDRPDASDMEDRAGHAAIFRGGMVTNRDGLAKGHLAGFSRVAAAIDGILAIDHRDR